MQLKGIGLPLDTVSMVLINAGLTRSQSCNVGKFNSMKRLSRVVDIATLLVFLIAFASNCVQASRVTLDSVLTSTPVFSGLNSSRADHLDFLIADDQSDDTPILNLVHDTVSPIEAVHFPRSFSPVFVVAGKVKQATILRI